MKVYNNIKLILFAALTISPFSLWSATLTQTVPISATVITSCQIGSPTPSINFGTSVNVLSSTPVTANGTLTLTCNNKTVATLALNVGALSGSCSAATYAARCMPGTTGNPDLTYNIYTTTGLTTVWGNGTGSTATVSYTGTGTPGIVTLYGQIPLPQATVVSGAYADTVTMTITY